MKRRGAHKALGLFFVWAALPAAGGLSAPPSASAAPVWDGRGSSSSDVVLSDGRSARLRDDGMLVIRGPHDRVPRLVRVQGFDPHGTELGSLSAAELEGRGPRSFHAHPYADGTVVIVPANGAQLATGARSVDPRSFKRPGGAVAYTTDSGLNAALTSLGVDHVEPLLGPRATNAGLHGSHLAFERAFRAHVLSVSAPVAVTKLRALPSVAYVAPDYYVTSFVTRTTKLSRGQVERAAAEDRRTTGAADAAPGIPNNYAVRASAQSFLNSSGVNAVVPFAELEKAFGELPGAGEIVSDVSIGSLVTQSETARCNGYVPTTIVSGGQRYLDWPSMPLIPTFTVGSDGRADGLGGVCGEDSLLTEAGGDFSVMSPLPHALQRSGARGSGYSDLLGIAPGASYRLVVPSAVSPTVTDIDQALIAAASQHPAPNVITVSLGFGYDEIDGFPSRFLEDDPVTESVIASIVEQLGIVVCVSANDGIRDGTTGAIPPSGSAIETNVARWPGERTFLPDLAMSTAPSFDEDSGSFAVGGTTLDDIYSAPEAQGTLAFPEVRWNGSLNFASGRGGRVAVAAPADNLLAVVGGTAASGLSIEAIVDGTSFSAPAVAAASAVALQLARLEHRTLRPADVLALLSSTGRPISDVPQADEALHVGPQVDVGRLVERELSAAGLKTVAQADRVGVAERQAILPGAAPGLFVTDTDASAIDLRGPLYPDGQTFSGENSFSPISIAPDWQGLPAGARFVLTPAGRPRTLLATTPTARLLPADLLRFLGPSRNVTLVYRALAAGRVVAERHVALVFGPLPSRLYAARAPVVPAVVSGNVLHVEYDLRNVVTRAPKLLVSEPGRPDAAVFYYHRLQAIPLASDRGSIDIPVATLGGDGIYGVAIALRPTASKVLYEDCYLELACSEPAFTRVAATASARPPAPMLSGAAAPAGHFLELPWAGTFTVSWDVSSVPTANGAMLEIGAPGPVAFGNALTFNNPNGSVRDDNGVDAGSTFVAPLAGARGTASFDGTTAALFGSMTQPVRVLPTSNGRIVGEASEVSTLEMDGLVPPASGDPYPAIVFGTGLTLPPQNAALDTSGKRGFVTTFGRSSDGIFTSILATFDARSNVVTHQTLEAVGDASSFSSYFPIPGLGELAGGTALFGIGRPLGATPEFEQLDIAKPGTGGNDWTPPTPPLLSNSNTVFGGDATSSKVAELIDVDENGSIAPAIQVSDVVKNTSEPPIRLPMPGPYTYVYDAVAFDGASDTAIVARVCQDTSTCGGYSQEESLVVLDTKARRVVSAVNLPGTQAPDVGVAFDPVARVAATSTLTGQGATPAAPFATYDLKTGAVNVSPVRGEMPFALGVDTQRHRFFVATEEAGFTTGPRPHRLGYANYTSEMDEYSETGALLRRLTGFNSFAYPWPNAYAVPFPASSLAVSPETRTVYVGNLANGFQLEPVRY